ncbi:hypothetical protein Tco_0410394 [Tanacetum coccineum]
MLEKGIYVPWASRFMRFLENKQEEGELMRNSIDNGPYKWKDITDPNNTQNTIHEPISRMSKLDKNQYFADIKNRIKRLMQGSDISQQERHSRLMNKFGKFVAVEGESLTSMYERFSTLINVMDRNQVRPPVIAANTMFLNSLQPEWSKYVTMTCQQYILKTKEYDALFDHLSQFEPHVNASKAKKAARNHDPLALVANSNAHSLNSHISSLYSRLTTSILSVIMIVRIKPIDDKSDAKPTYDYEFISEVNASKVDMINGLLSKSDHELQIPVEQTYLSSPSTSNVSSVSSSEKSYLPSKKMPNESKLLKLFVNLDNELNQLGILINNSIQREKERTVIQIVLWIVDGRCSKHMTGNQKLQRNFVEKFMGTVRFGKLRCNHWI